MGRSHYKKPELLLQPDSVFTPGNQMFTAVAIQMLAQDGLLFLDEPAGKYLPQFNSPPHDQITLFHLLTHSSGLYPSAGVIPDKHHINCYELIAEQIEKDGMDADWIAAGLRAGMYCEPGTRWVLSSFGYNVLGAIIEKASGHKATDFIMERLCKPLGMTDTLFIPTPDMARRAVIFDEYDEETMEAAERGKPLSNGLWDTISAPASGLFSTITDLVHIGIMLQQNGIYNGTRILGRRSVKCLTTEAVRLPDYCFNANGAEHIFSLGFNIKYTYYGDLNKENNNCWLTSPETCSWPMNNGGIFIIDPVEELVCVCYHPWTVKGLIGEGKVGQSGWNPDCNNRVQNVFWSGLM
jgi:CubicO group peptidase (beta-lactamase class C family)